MAKSSKAKCECGCGQSPAARTRQRKMTCGCGAAIVYLSRAAVQTVNASCALCHDELLPVCLFDRALLDSPDGAAAVAQLEARYDRALKRAAPKVYSSGPQKFRCGDCSAWRAPHGSCTSCGSERPPTTSFMHPRAARAAGGDMPF